MGKKISPEDVVRVQDARLERLNKRIEKMRCARLHVLLCCGVVVRVALRNRGAAIVLVDVLSVYIALTKRRPL